MGTLYWSDCVFILRRAPDLEASSHRSFFMFFEEFCWSALSLCWIIMLMHPSGTMSLMSIKTYINNAHTHYHPRSCHVIAIMLVLYFSTQSLLSNVNKAIIHWYSQPRVSFLEAFSFNRCSRFIIHIYLDEIYEYAFHVLAIFGIQAFSMKI